MPGMSRPVLTALYFVLTFLAGGAVGSWMLWVYLIGFPSQPSAEPVAATPAPAATASPIPAESEQAPATSDTASPAAAPGGPTPKGHWNTVDVPGRSHAECLALTKELNDAYKDCRFGVHKEVWVAD